MPELDSAITCDKGSWRASIVFDYPEDKDWTNPELTYDTLKDTRDGRIYETITINGITVMAENLAYGDSVKNAYLKGNSWCYNNDTLNCRKGGRYYTWTATMNIDSKWKGDSPYAVEGLIKKPHQGICPDGWHIPTNDEWNTLFNNIGYEAQQALGNPEWKNATNESGFSALPVGSYSGHFGNVGSHAFFWIATEKSSSTVYRWNLNAGGAYFNYIGKNDGSAVRCFKDN